MDKITSLSQAIRVGSLSTKQCRGTVYKVEQREEYTCAIGAAAYALGFYAKDPYLADYIIGRTDDLLYERFPALRGLKVRVSQPTLREECNILEAMTWLNDHLGWTREQIADWLEAKGL